MEFGVCIDHQWKGSTYASSEKKARSNLAYQYKIRNNRLPAARIELPGTISMVS